MIVKQLGILSVAKIMGITQAIMGFIFGLFFGFFGLVMTSLSPQMHDIPGFFGLFFGLGAVIFMPIMYGVAGFVFGAIGAWLYNLIAGWVGGVEVHFEQEAAVQPASDLSAPLGA